MPLPDVYPLISSPGESSYRLAQSRLLLQHLLGDPDAARVLEILPTLYHFLVNYDYYIVLYGQRRATRKLLSLLRAVRSESKDRVSTLLELYKVDSRYLEPLVDALLELKLEVMREGAPENLMKLFDETIAAAGSAKRASFIRKVQLVLSYVRMFREAGPEQVSRAVDILLNRPVSSSPAPAPMPQLKHPTDADQVSLLRYIAESNVSGVAPSKDDVLNYFGGDAVKATSLVHRLRSGHAPRVLFDKAVGGYVVTPAGLKQLADDGILTPVMVRRLVAYMKKSPLITKLVARGIFKPPEVLVGLREDEDEEEGADGEEEE